MNIINGLKSRGHPCTLALSIGIGELCSTIVLLCYANMLVNPPIMPTIMLNHVTCVHAQRMPCHVPSAKLLVVDKMASALSSSSSSTILDLLKLPEKSDLARKRKIEKPKTTGTDMRRKSVASNQTDPKPDRKVVGTRQGWSGNETHRERSGSAPH